MTRSRPESVRPRPSRNSPRSSSGNWLTSASMAAETTTWRAPIARARSATRAEKVLPVAAEPSSTLQTNRIGLEVISCRRLAASTFSGAMAVLAILPSCSALRIGSIRSTWNWLSLSPPLAFFCNAGRRFSRLSRSASISSVSMVSASRIGSTLPSTWVTSVSSKQRSTCTMASTSRILARNWLPRPTPLDAPRTRPAISTNSRLVGTFFCERPMVVRMSRRGSGTATRPTLGSMVQNG